MAEKVNKKSFEVKVGEGDSAKTVSLVVRRPDQAQQQRGQLVYNRAFREAVRPSDGKKGAIVRQALEGVLREQGLWDDEKERLYRECVRKLAEGEQRLKKGGVRLSEGRAIAIDMRRQRAALQSLLTDRNALDVNTAEAQAENARFNYFVSACTVDKANVPHFKNEDDYNSRADDPVALEAAKHLANLLYDLSDDWFMRLPENAWLKAYSYIDEDGRLTDRATGGFVDEEGNPVDKHGRRLNAEGVPCAEDGTPLPLFEEEVRQAPFLDDDGNPVAIPEGLKAEAKAGDEGLPADAGEKHAPAGEKHAPAGEKKVAAMA